MTEESPSVCKTALFSLSTISKNWARIIHLLRRSTWATDDGQVVGGIVVNMMAELRENLDSFRYLPGATTASHLCITAHQFIRCAQNDLQAKLFEGASEHFMRGHQLFCDSAVLVRLLFGLTADDVRLFLTVADIREDRQEAIKERVEQWVTEVDKWRCETERPPPRKHSDGYLYPAVMVVGTIALATVAVAFLSRIRRG